TACQHWQLIVWVLGKDYAPTQQLLIPGSADPITDVAFSPDGHTLAAIEAQGIILWDITRLSPRTFSSQAIIPITTLKVSTTLSKQVIYSRIVFSPDSSLLVSYSGFTNDFAFVLWDMAQYKQVADPYIDEGTLMGSLAFSSDSNHIMSAALIKQSMQA